MTKRVSIALTLAALGTAAACTVHQTTAPSLSGPSEYALSVSMTAQPDAINQDGGSQSGIHVSAHDGNGKPVAGQTFRLDIFAGGTQVDYGTLSARTLVTGTDGTAFATYTAPPPLPNGATVGTCHGLAGTCIDIVATPTGTDFQAAQNQVAEIRLMPTGLILPPVPLPTAQFTTSPALPTAVTPMIFDGSSSCAGSIVTTGSGTSAVSTCLSNGLTIINYQWSFGDGGSATGQSASHAYNLAQSFSVSLTVTNSAGGTNTATKAVTVGAGVAPTAKFTFSPTDPAITGNRNLVAFNADSSTAGAGHTITQFNWDFGDPPPPGGYAGLCAGESNSASGFQVSHTYCGQGTYKVTLSVADDAGQKTVSSQDVKINP